MNQKEDLSFVDPQENEIIKDPKTGKTISRKRAFVLAGGAMAAGAALSDFSQNTDIPELMLDSDGDGIADTVLTDTNNDGIYELPSETNEENVISAESPDQQAWNPNTAPMASPGSINNDMSFSEAFSAAREELGAGGVFVWQGQYYNTFYAEELNDENQPIVDYPVTEHHDLLPVDQTNLGPMDADIPADGELSPENDFEPHIMALDVNQDGQVDAIFVDLNQDGSADIMYTDLNEDGQITDDEFIIIHDPETLTIPESPTDGSFMTVDLDADGIDDVLIADVDGDQFADIMGIDENKDQNIDESETTILNPGAFEGMEFGAGSVDYSGEISTDMPEDVPDEMLDSMSDDLSSLEDNFDEINEWS